MQGDKLIKGGFTLRKNTLILLLVVVISVTTIFTGCSTTSNAPAPAPENSSQNKQVEPTKLEAKWTQEHITQVKPLILKDPFLEMLGQTKEPIPYYYEEVVKLSGHSCGAVTGAWTITRKALEALYPGDIPVRGQIKITAPGAADEWFVGVFGEVMTYITGAAPETGFPGSEFGQDYNRRNLMIYSEEPTNTPPAQMVWIFERIDTGAKVGVNYDVTKVMPPATPERNAMSAKMAASTATEEEAADWIKYWNDRAMFVLENADTLDGFFTVQKLN